MNRTPLRGTWLRLVCATFLFAAACNEDQASDASTVDVGEQADTGDAVASADAADAPTSEDTGAVDGPDGPDVPGDIGEDAAAPDTHGDADAIPDAVVDANDGDVAEDAPDAAADDATDDATGDSVEDATDAGDPADPPAPISRDPIYDVRVRSDVVYGQGAVRRAWDAERFTVTDLVLDVYGPVDAPGPRPALVCIHGGGFRGGDKLHAAMVRFAEGFAARGWVTFSINYRLQRDAGLIPDAWPEAPVEWDPDQVRALYPAARDTKAALRWVHTNAERLDIHPDYITVLGGSAGSFLAVMAGASDPGDFTDELLDEDPTLATTNLGARSDVATVIDHWGGHAHLLALEMMDGRSRWDATDAPISIVHGTEDPTVPFAAAEALRAAYESTGVPYAWYPLEGRGHGVWGATYEGRSLLELAFDFVVEQQGLGLLPE